MKVMFDGTSDYHLGPIQALDFYKLENDKDNLMFYYGIHPGFRMERPDTFKYNVYFETEEPNGFIGGQLPHERGRAPEHGVEKGNWDINFWDKVINICPYSAEWENKLYNTNKFTHTVYPYDPDKIIENEKEYDVLYVGGLHGRHGIFSSIVEKISHFNNYRFISLNSYPLATDVGVTNERKMEIWSKSKITVCANLLSENYVGQYQKIKTINAGNWKGNRAFTHVDRGILPQMKPRITDAIVSKSLVLLYKDPWNVMETWFTPNEHFLYFDSFEELPNRIQWCLNNWDHCSSIAQNAFDHFMENYTTVKFYEKHLKEFDK